MNSCRICFALQHALLHIVDINECETYNGGCLNGGACVNERGGFYCECAMGFTGKNCSECMYIYEYNIYTSYTRIVSVPYTSVHTEVRVST